MAISDGNGQSAVVGTAVATKPAVVLKDQFNNLVPNVPVTFLVTSGGGSATGTSALSNGQGIATVGSWTLGDVAGPNTLRASAPGVTPVTFIATGLAGAPVKLAFVTQPSRSLAGDTIEPPVRVAIQDQFGNTVLPVTDVVHVDLGATPTPGAKLVGTTDVPAVNGVAVFPNLAIDSAGIGYTLRASTPKIAGNEESAPFDVGGVIAAFTSDRWEPVAAAFNPVTKLVYVPGLNNNVGVLDPGKSLTMLPGFQTPFGVAVNSLTNRIYVTTAQGVVVMSGQGNVIVATIAVGPNPKGIAVDEATNRIYVAVDGDPSKDVPPKLVPIDGSKNEVIVADVVPFPIGIAGIGVAFNPRDRFVYVAMPAPQEVWVIDPSPGKAGVVMQIRNLGKFTYGVGVDGRNGLLFATNQDDNTVSVIDISSPDPAAFKEITRVPVGRLPQGIGVDEDRGMVYVGNSGEATVSFIDGAKFEVIATLFVGPAPKAAAVNLGSGQFFVPTFGDDRVRVVQP
jgi:YVTN family beta-propeller protein